MGRLANIVPTADFSYDTTARDWAISGGDMVILTTMSDQLTQLIVDAMESTFNSEPYVNRAWGFEGRNIDLSDNDDSKQYAMIQFVDEIMRGLRRMTKTILAKDFVFPRDQNNFSFTVEAVLSDISQTSYDKTFSWNGTTKRVTVT